MYVQLTYTCREHHHVGGEGGTTKRWAIYVSICIYLSIYIYTYIHTYVKIIDVLCKEKYTFCSFENTKTPVVAAAYVRTSHEPGPPESAETEDWAKELGLANGFSAMLALLMG